MPIAFIARKSVSELQQRALNEIAQLREDADNRFTFQSRDIAKRYIEGRLEICLKFRPRRGGQEFHGLCRRAGAGIVENKPMAPVEDNRQTGHRIKYA
jgi:hypothetical protein